jgi:hypothetical protein
MENNQFPTFENFREESKANEAMVQVAGKSKPSGAKVLAMVIVDALEGSKMLKPGANIDAVKDAVQTIIMNSTF